MRVIERDGRWFAMLLRGAVGNDEVVAVDLPRRMPDAKTLAFALEGDFAPGIELAQPPPELKLGPFYEAALAAPLSIDEAVPTPPAFLDWWRRICSGELERGQLAGEGEGGDPLDAEPELSPIRRARG